jgi:hypothetical protein
MNIVVFLSSDVRFYWQYDSLSTCFSKHVKNDDNNVTLCHVRNFIADIDECKNNPCSGHAICKNTPGTFECICPPGYPKGNPSSGTCERDQELRFKAKLSIGTYCSSLLTPLHMSCEDVLSSDTLLQNAPNKLFKINLDRGDLD